MASWPSLSNPSNQERTWTWEVGVGWLRLSEIEAMARLRAKIMTAKVSKALALYPYFQVGLEERNL
ncbi:hypothetical protein ACE6H2_002924 [Prunus campanulata]